MQRFLPMSGCGIAVVVLSAWTAVVWAEKALPPDQLTNGPRVLAAFEPVTAAVRPSVVQVLMDDEPVALGLIVSADGLVISKASEVDPLHQLTIQRGKEKLPARAVGWSDTHDLVLLQVHATGWPLPAWSDGSDPAIGQFLITPGNDKLPVAVGVVSVARRAVARDQIRGVLGIQMPDDSDQPSIKGMSDDSAAKAAGLMVGDLILKVDSVTIRSRHELRSEIRNHQPGETVMLEVRRGAKTLNLPATLTHPFGDFLSRIAQQNRMGGDISSRAGGFPAVIQHDSVLEPDECGGPAVNMEGQIIGINIARSGRTESLLLPTSVVQDVLQSHRDGKLPPLRTHSPLVPPPPLPTLPLE